MSLVIDMKLIMESFRKFIDEQNDISKTEEDGKVTYQIDGGYITVIENSQYAHGAHSVYGFFVDEDRRGEGLGKTLIQIIIDSYPNDEISAQASSLASLKAFMDLGFRVTANPAASFEEARTLFDDNHGSLNIRLNDPDMV